MKENLNIYELSKEYLVSQTMRLFGCDETRAIEIVNEYSNTPNVTTLSFANILEELASTLQTGQSLPNVINYLNRKNDLRRIFKNYNPQLLGETDEDELFTECVQTFGECVNNGERSWKIYIGGMVDGASILKRFDNVQSFIDAINDFENTHGLTFEQYQDVMPTKMRASKGTNNWKIYGMKNALACNFLKEIGFANYVKPDTHLKAAFDAVELPYTSDDDCLRIGRELAASYGVTPYALDRVIWLCCSGHYYRHVQNKLGGGSKKLKEPYLDYLKEKNQE